MIWSGSLLYICPTPIGNLEDITIRTLNTLKSVDLIACEDTRTSLKLLNNYDIKKKLISYHKFNFEERIPKLLGLLKNGEEIALISDAGMPGISDPGCELIRSCIEENIDFLVLPGASASVTALVYSGLDNESFTFVGFLPEKKSGRRKKLEELKNYRETLIFYEAPHRVKDMLLDLYESFGDRKISICREMTKLHEEIIRGNLSEIIDNIDDLKVKGEFVIVVQKKEEIKPEIDIKAELLKLTVEGVSKSKAVKIVSEKFDLKKNEVYKASIDL